VGHNQLSRNINFLIWLFGLLLLFAPTFHLLPRHRGFGRREICAQDASAGGRWYHLLHDTPYQLDHRYGTAVPAYQYLHGGVCAGLLHRALVRAGLGFADALLVVHREYRPAVARCHRAVYREDI